MVQLMHTKERMEARIVDANNILLALSTLKDESLSKDFCGHVIRMDSLSTALPSFAQKTVYLCGDLSRVKDLDLDAARRIFVIRELSHSYSEDENGKAFHSLLRNGVNQHI